jgi:hypothetical protein
MRRLAHQDELAAWNERFASFNDAVLKSWSVKLASTKSVFEAQLEAKDQASPSGWSLVNLRASGVTSVQFCDGPRASYRVLSNGLHTLFDAGRIALEFGDFTDVPESFSELMNSPCHVVAEILEWEAQPVSQ